MGCNCGGGRGRQVTVTASGAAGGAYTTSASNVKYRHVTDPVGGGFTDYNTPDEADAARQLLGGEVRKVDQDTGRSLA
ncbi:hypothetical protein [Streptomyces sp. NPDC088739]|uniref:hypothetical protein n=1 Tax=Streptomyces sp. NPDC088739 TaxID=3365882 RepID=UPI0037F29F5B